MRGPGPQRAQEEAWIRQGIQARRTRNEGRVRALKALCRERAARREVEGKARITLEEARASGKLVVEAECASFAWLPDEAPVVDDFSIRIMRGDRIGLIGPNGVGKTTLLQLLLGERTPTAGSVRLGTKLEIAYYDQLRTSLDPDRTVLESIAEGREYVEIAGRRKHAIGYLQDFLFSPARARTPVGALSGGERNRLLLARLFTQPANLLVLDEATNDLDIETLELLEALLVGFQGTIPLVSHDRAFLDNVVTSTLVFEGGGRIREHVGGYSDWAARRDVAAAASPPSKATAERADSPRKRSNTPRKLGYKHTREIEELPARIEALEAEQAALVRRMSDPTFYEEATEEQADVHARVAEITPALEAAYERWSELEALRDEIES